MTNFLTFMQACYAVGYNLAIEYLADYEKTWMLDSFRALNARVLVPQQRGLSQWLFLEVKFPQHLHNVIQCCIFMARLPFLPALAFAVSVTVCTYPSS
jgi:hypothetical protein